MKQEANHISDEELLLASEAELELARQPIVEAHLASCSACRDRAAALDRKLHDFGEVYRQECSRVAAIAEKNTRENQEERQPRSATIPGWVWIPVAAVLVFGVLQFRGAMGTANTIDKYSEPLPNSRLTPGAVRTTDARNVCTMAPETKGGIPTGIRTEVLSEYRLKNALAQDYEIDYLITPELGGATDVRNLWPEPYSDTPWNAHIKDQLEEYLRAKVCQGTMDLPTAQKEMASNWIVAYKKYFHTDAPLSENPALVRN